MVHDLLGVLIELHPQLHLDREAPPHIPGFGVVQSASIAGPPLKPENVAQERDLRHRFGALIPDRIAVIKDGLLIVT